MTQEFADKLYAMPCHPKTHAIIAAMLGRDPLTTAKFVGKAICTSDGYLQCNFVDAQGVSRHSAFVGSYDEVEENLQIATEDQSIEWEPVQKLLKEWIVIDYRIAR